MKEGIQNPNGQILCFNAWTTAYSARHSCWLSPIVIDQIYDNSWSNELYLLLGYRLLMPKVMMNLSSSCQFRPDLVRFDSPVYHFFIHKPVTVTTYSEMNAEQMDMHILPP